MISEIMLLMKGLDTAMSLLEKGFATKKRVTDLGNEVDNFFRSKEKLEERLAEEKKEGTYSQSPLEQAMFEERVREKIEKHMQVLSKEYSRQGKSHIFAKLKRRAVNIERDRAFETNLKNKRARAKQQKTSDVIFTIKLFVGGLVIIAAIFGTVFYTIGE
tara:strand:+ start:15 stop:494 length:480 start_codon:yes stop_codon:yes gene_type:complete